MSKNQKTAVFGFVKWLTERYIELERKALPNACKLIGITNRNNQRLVKIQLAGLLDELEIEPEKIIEQNLFEYFSSEDKKKLFSLMYDKVRLKLSDQYFCQDTGKEMLVLAELETGNKLTLSAENASVNSGLVSQVSSKDAAKIGFLSGMEYSKKCFTYSKVPK